MEIEKYIICSDQRLVAMSLEGDMVGLEHLFNRYRDSILQLYAQYAGVSREDADDLLQGTFIKVYLKLHRYSADYTFGQWIYAIARNTLIDHVRKRRDELSLDRVPVGNGTMVPAASSPTPEESVINSQKRDQLQHHLEKMTPRYRRLIELRFFKDYSYEEVAAELKIPIGTVKTQIHRARKQLCRFIANNSDILP